VQKILVRQVVNHTIKNINDPTENSNFSTEDFGVSAECLKEVQTAAGGIADEQKRWSILRELIVAENGKRSFQKFNDNLTSVFSAFSKR
jgi:hypothetical protein